jgi:hypothetical protein
VQIPKLIIHEFKLEPHQVVKVGFTIPDKFKGWQSFYAKMEKAGRISIPMRSYPSGKTKEQACSAASLK